MLGKILSLPEQIPNVLSKLIENAKTLPKEQQRQKQAYYEYWLYGAPITYRLDNNQVVYYEPSEDDKSHRLDMEKSEIISQHVTAFIKKMMMQFPYLFTLYASTYFCTFLIGGIWLIFKMPATSLRTSP